MSRNVDWIYLQGKGRWVKLIRPDVEYSCWSVNLLLTPESYEQVLKLKEGTGDYAGILNDIKKDEDGYSITLKRPIQKVYKGLVTSFTPPELTDADGNPWQSEKLIGNGSDLTCKIERYKYTSPVTRKKGTAIRLVAVRIDNLIPYERKDYTPAQAKAVSGLRDQPPQQLF